MGSNGRWQVGRFLAALGMALVLAGCASGPNKAPIEDRKPAAPRAAATNPAVALPIAADAEAARALPGSENAGKPGYYTVKAGDTLVRIALENGQNWRDLQRWNAIDNPNLIEVGQVLRVAPPTADASAVASARPVAPAGRVDSRPLDGRPAAAAATPAGPTTTPGPVASGAAASGVPSAPVPASAAPAPVAAPAARPAVRDADEDVQWLWPAAGPVATAFDEARSKGVAITGKAGDPVYAAADGRVVYAGSGLRGYGNLLILKHNTTYLSAYAHNQALLVKEDQVVRRGQKIAEMGSSDADRVQLHFEIRQKGVPIDPLRLLPPR